MMIRKFSRTELASEADRVLYADLYPWDAIEETPFGCSMAIVQVGGSTMLHSHDPAETFIICRGTGTVSIDDRSAAVAEGDVIYLPPESTHSLRNDSATEDLVFVSVFWSANREPRVPERPRLLLPSPPTPNGPLHLGHLAGPYVLADIIRRYDRMHGVPSMLVCLLDDHQSYVADRAKVEGTSATDLAARFGEQIVTALNRVGARPDVVIAPSLDADYQAAVLERFAALRARGHLEERELPTLACDTCAIPLYDSFVRGGCPHCGQRTFGGICDACSNPVDAAELVEPRCDHCQRHATVRTVRRLVFPLGPFKASLADYHRDIRLSPKLRRLAAQWRETTFAPAATQLGTWGIAAPGLDGQIISPWFEVALASPYLRERYGRGGPAGCLFGYDNAFLYLVQDPAVSLALDKDAPLPDELLANEFLLLDDAKMSTSRSHSIDANALLAHVPADLVRVYLAKVRPDDARTSVNVDTARMFMTFVAQLWQGWLTRLGTTVAAEAHNRAPAAADSTLVPWSPEQRQFLRQLEGLVARARQAYEARALKDVSSVLHELVERAGSFGASQLHFAGIASLATERATGLALELAAARTLAMLASPLMPTFAARLWTCLGHAGAISWIDDIAPIQPGQPIALAGVQFFPLSSEQGA